MNLFSFVFRKTPGTLCLLAVTFLLTGGAMIKASPITYTDNIGTSNYLPMLSGEYSVANGNGIFVVVGASDYIYRSTDGHHWSLAADSVFVATNYYTSLTFGKGLFVATGNAGRIITSSDGNHWVAQHSTATRDLTSVIYANGVFLAVGNHGAVLYSTDATNWAAFNVNATNDLAHLSYGSGKFAMVYGDNSSGADNGGIASSTTGTNNWTYVHPSSNDTYVPSFWGCLNNKFYASYPSSLIWTSPDAITWSQYTAPVGGSPLSGNGYGVYFGAYINGTYYLGGSAFGSGSGTVFTSTDGNLFRQLPQGQSAYMNSLVITNGVYVQGNGAGFATSTNGTNWFYPSGSYAGSAYDGTNYVIVGGGGSDSDGYIAISSDWVNWTNVTPGYMRELGGVAYSKGKFVAVGYFNSLILTSTNGVNWATTNISNDGYVSIATDGSGTFVAVTSSGNVLRSADNGVTWNFFPSGTGAELNYVTYINSQFVAVGYGGTIIYSTDGRSWADASYIADPGAGFTGITYGPNGYVVSGVDTGFNTLYVKGATLASSSWAVPANPPPPVPGYFGQVPVHYANGVYLGAYQDGNQEAYLTYSTDGDNWISQDLNVVTVVWDISYWNNSFRVVGFSDYRGTATVAVPPPGITSILTANGTYGNPFNYTITASNHPTSFGASGLPAGLGVVSSTGVISGTPTQSGTYAISLGATNSSGSGTATLTLSVAKADLTASDVVALDKTYDGTSAATLDFSGASLNGLVNGDSLTFNGTGYTANFSSANAGSNQTVTVSGLTLSGAAATNYNFAQPTGLMASILPAPATVTLNRSVQLYDGSAKSVSATTAPSGLSMNYTYNGSASTPSGAGAYTVVGTVTDPNYAGSVTNFLYVAPTPNFLSVKTNATQIVFTWNALPQVNYQVIYTADLLTPWLDFGGPVTATNAAMPATDTINRDIPAHFYRIKVILE